MKTRSSKTTKLKRKVGGRAARPIWPLLAAKHPMLKGDSSVTFPRPRFS
jgi:hypothetical protein